MMRVEFTVTVFIETIEQRKARILSEYLSTARGRERLAEAAAPNPFRVQRARFG